MTPPNPSKPSDVETEILELSLEKFRWKTTGQFDRLEDLFDDGLVFVHLNGNITSRQAWMDELRSGRFRYDRIDHKASFVKSHGSTAVLVGRAAFHVSMGGFKATYNLVYTEVYVNTSGTWKLVNIHTCSA